MKFIVTIEDDEVAEYADASQVAEDVADELAESFGEVRVVPTEEEL